MPKSAKDFNHERHEKHEKACVMTRIATRVLDEYYKGNNDFQYYLRHPNFFNSEKILSSRF